MTVLWKPSQKTVQSLLVLASRPRRVQYARVLQPHRLFRSSKSRVDPHRTYFQPDSPQPQSQQHYAYDTQPPSPKRWPLLLVTFLAFPALYLITEAVAAKGFIPEFLSHLLFPQFRMAKALDDVNREYAQLQDMATHESDMHQGTQRLLREQLTASDGPGGRTVVRDDEIIERRPIYLDDGRQVAKKDACLLRVVDDAGRNTIVILGVDLNVYAPRSERDDSDLQGLHRWVYQLLEDMHGEGATAFNTEGETMYILYTNNAIGMGPFYMAGNSIGGMTSHTEIIVVDTLKLPPGWPLKQMRRVKECEETDSRVKAKDTAPHSPTAVSILGPDSLPHGPFR
ncbi:hypothetical protein FH972_024252 [Carpinus fangiana]|uniref:Uncharacterized protein n=1 Tax=Carpinus fangiana TaxID=176857 RepID=A0A5N6KXU2_9ROSI|nr:hypothetical protein FH972_024252 [Carpinus fangiana]